MKSFQIGWMFIALMVIGLLCTNYTQAQEALGLKTGKYAGINGTLLNPSSNVYAPLKWDVNLVAAGAFFENNYGYLTNTAVPNALKNASLIEWVNEEAGDDATISTNPILFDFFDDNKRKSIHLNAFVMGPSVRLNVGKHSFGLFTNFRTAISANRIPASLGYYEFDRQLLNESFKAAPFKFAGMAWAELGLNYATEIMEGNNHRISAGGNVKYLHAYNAFFFKSHEEVELTKLPNDSLALNGGSYSYGISNAAVANNPFASTGKGLAIDLGTTYLVGGTEDKNYSDYQFKFGCSLLDFGKVWGNNEAQVHEVNTAEIVNIYTEGYNDVTDELGLFTTISQQALNDETASRSNKRFSLWLPGAISAQADFAANKHLYLNALVTRRIRTIQPGIERANIIAVTPRFESRFLAFSLPLVLYNDTDFRLGSALRLGPITIGSDNLLTWIRPQNELTGTDVYVALKVNPVHLAFSGKSKKWNADKRMKNAGSGKCYQF